MAQIEPAELGFPAVDIGDGLTMSHEDGRWKVRKGVRLARKTDIPLRTDLAIGNPLREKPLLRVVPSGMPDCTIDDEGNLVPVDERGDPYDVR